MMTFKTNSKQAVLVLALATLFFYQAHSSQASVPVDAIGNTALHQAVTSPDALNELRRLKEQGHQLEAQNKLGATPLFSAVSVGRMAAVQALISLGANIHTTNRMGQGLAHIAAYMQHADVLHFLHSKGVDLNKTDRRGVSPLHWAVEQNKIQGATSLIQLGADIMAVDKRGRTALHIAALYGYADHIHMLANSPVRGGVKAPIEAHMFVEGDALTPLCLAAAGLHKQAVEALVQAGARIDVPCRWKMPALHNALYDKHSTMVKVLIQLGADTEARDFMGATALHLAVELGRTQDVSTLLSAGADVKAQTQDGSQAVHIAANAGRLDELKHLQQAGAAFNVKDHSGATPMHNATRLDVIQFLAARGVSLDVPDNQGRTPLYHWILSTRVNEVRWAVAQGVNTRVRDARGQSPLDVARAELKKARQEAKENVAEDTEDPDSQPEMRLADDIDSDAAEGVEGAAVAQAPYMLPDLSDVQLNDTPLEEAKLIVQMLQK